jgi:hypothetical protein
MTSRLQHFRSSLVVAALAAFGFQVLPHNQRQHRPGRLIRNWSRIWSLPAASLRITACSTAGATYRSGTTAIPSAF